MTGTRRFSVRWLGFALLLFPLPLSAASAEPPSPIEKRELEPGDYVWQPGRTESGPVEIVISLPLQLAYVYRGGTLIGMSTISAGRAGYETPLGRFEILQKRRIHHSNRYDNAPMPFMQRLTWRGVALHGGHVPGYPASHGCIRLPTAFARRLYSVTGLGDAVTVVDAPMSAETALEEARTSA